MKKNRIRETGLGLVCWIVVRFPQVSLAQYYDDYGDTVSGPTTFQKIMTSPAASLIMVLAGAAGLLSLFFSTGKGDRSDKQQVFGIFMVLAVIGMAWYRFSLWNDPDFNSR